MTQSTLPNRPSTIQRYSWIIDGLILLALCIAAANGHRVAFNFFALFAMAGLLIRGHWTGVYIFPAWLRLALASLYLPSCAVLAAAAFDMLSGTVVDVARWGFIAACAVALAGRLAGWRLAGRPADAA